MSTEEKRYHAMALNKSFSELQRRLNSFNIFRATGMSEQEIKHTQFLGYLLNPNESHGLKDDFLLRFLQAAQNDETNSIPLADLNLNYANITKEKRINHNNKNEIIDIYIEIPSLTDSKKSYVVAVENKINATQGDGQLKAYQEAIEEKYGNNASDRRRLFFYFYLTLFGEQPDNQAWMSITYSETVLPAIEGILKDNRETISDYMAYVLQDYIDLIKNLQEQEPENDLDNLIDQIPAEIIDTSRELARSNLSNFGISSAIGIRYAKAVDYIKRYRRDPRASLLNYFNSDGCETLLRNNGFTREHSTRSFLRLSFLEKEIGDQFQRYCTNPTRNWLDSYRHLAIELVIQKKGSALHCDVILVLGPTGAAYAGNRVALVETLRAAANYQQNRSSTDHFTRITPEEFNDLRLSFSVKDAKEKIKDIIQKISNGKYKERLKIIEAALKEFLTTVDQRG